MFALGAAPALLSCIDLSCLRKYVAFSCLVLPFSPCLERQTARGHEVQKVAPGKLERVSVLDGRTGHNNRLFAEHATATTTTTTRTKPTYLASRPGSGRVAVHAAHAHGVGPRGVDGARVGGHVKPAAVPHRHHHGVPARHGRWVHRRELSISC